MQDDGRYRARLTALNHEIAGRNQPTAYRRPRDAATLILVDRSGRMPRVLFGRRNTTHAFMPGMYVFPGGSIDDADRRMTSVDGLDPRCLRRLMAHVTRPTVARARALALAAIRETFEETGLLLGTTTAGAPVAPSAHWGAFAAHGVTPQLSTVRFLARAITPPRRARRFDTRFFVADASNIAARVEGMVGPQAELIETCWVTFDEARTLRLPAITRAVLEELADRMARGFDAAPPVSFYRVAHGHFGRIAID